MLNKWAEFEFLKPVSSKGKCYIDDLSIIVFDKDGYSGIFEDIFQVLTNRPTPNVIVDAFITSKLHSGDGYVPITWYTHYQDPCFKGHPSLKLESSIIRNNRVICPVNTAAHGVGHTYLFVLYPRQLLLQVYDSCPQFTPKEIQMAHIKVLMKALYKGKELPKYKIGQMKTPLQTDDHSCAIIMLYVFQTINSTEYGRNIVLKRPSNAKLQAIRHEIAGELLSTTRIGREIMNYLVH
ncbi:unnamed protein product [Orchesella dallaii]|uniref:Ubiquitin-like protease family profile domain-containing protein n=1 Tax=Orchesella dallaii TaxID=48710 RepID=A0ABP1RWC6_9HEXA